MKYFIVPSFSENALGLDLLQVEWESPALFLVTKELSYLV